METWSSTYPVLCIVGPTSSGKSELAQVVAGSLQGEIISADSMQIYRGMDIGTGKVTIKNQRVRHFGIDLVDPGTPYSAQLFQTYSRNCIKDIQARGLTPILCGGTGFYIRAALDDYRFPDGEQIDNPTREFYTHKLKFEGSKAVWDSLNKLDSESASLIHPNNSKRVIRALEMNSKGVSYAHQVKKLKSLPQLVPACFVGLNLDRSILYERIEDRVEKMVSEGLVDEVKSLLKSGFRNGITAQQAIGYKEIVSYLESNCSLDEAINQIKISTRRYAKRQISWFKADERIHWIDVTYQSINETKEQTCKIYSNYKAEL